MSEPLSVEVALRPVLDPDFVPAALWNRAYASRVRKAHQTADVSIALARPDGTCSRYDTTILADPSDADLSLRYLERIVKFLLWQRGGGELMISGCDTLTDKIAGSYAPDGPRAFDYDFFGDTLYGTPLTVRACSPSTMPAPCEHGMPLGRHLSGCRIGFDLGGSDRKCAAVIDGHVVFSEEVEWSPYFESDPQYHIDGINDSLKRAAAHLPRVDAIGGSAAGVYVNNEVRVASLFRGISKDDFRARVRPLFHNLQAQWDGVPFVVVNDGEVTALAGSMSMKKNAVLGIAMGTSLAAGYVAPDGCITPWLNELAFAPVDYRADAPIDEWSTDLGCGVQYFSQQAVARLAPDAGLTLPTDMPFPEQLVAVQEHMKRGDDRAARIYATIGTYLGYTLVHYMDFYEIENILLLGRVTTGEGGTIIIKKARAVLDAEFPEIANALTIHTPDEKDKRHGQAVAAASLPQLAE